MEQPNEIALTDETQVSPENFKNGLVSSSLSGNIPVGASRRKMTDKYFLIIFPLCLIITLYFVIHTLSHSDISKLSGCSRCDEPLEKGQHYDPLHRPPKKSMLHFISTMAGRVGASFFISLGVCVTMILLLRFQSYVTAWGVLVGSFLFFLIGLLLFCTYGTDYDTFFPIMFGILAVILLFVIYAIRKHVEAISVICEEGIKVLFANPFIFIVSVLTMLLLLLELVGFLFITLYICSVDVFDGHAIAAVVLNTITSYLLFEVIIAIQYMIMSGAIAKLYFTRETSLENPVSESASIVFKYHLGTATLGSFFVGKGHSIRGFIVGGFIFSTFCPNLRRVVCSPFVSKNAYIATALHGTSFIQCNKKMEWTLSRPLWRNTGIYESVNCFSATCYLFLICITTGIFHLMVPEYSFVDGPLFFFVYLFVVGISFAVCFSILGTIDNVMNTVLLCIATDINLNNGTDRPFFMTKDMENVRNAVFQLFGRDLKNALKEDSPEE